MQGAAFQEHVNTSESQKSAAYEHQKDKAVTLYRGNQKKMSME